MGAWAADGVGGAGTYRSRHPLIGRDTELRAIVAALRAPDRTLVTITGRDGSGRTRLGLAALAAIAPDLPGGAVFVSMLGTDDRPSLLSSLAALLGVTHDGGTTPESALERRLLQLPTAILCDDADGRDDLLAAVAELVLSGGGRLLASAHRPLGLTGSR